MRIARVIGNMQLNHCHSSFEGASLRLVVPLELEELDDGTSDQAEFLVAWDEFNAGLGSLVAVSEGPEASQPFRPDLKPVDTYIAAILDSVEISNIP